MDELEPLIRVTRDDHRREVHYWLSGLFSEDLIPHVFSELFKASRPFIDDRKGFLVLGDLSAFKVQPRQLVEHMRFSQEASAKAGVERMAIVYSSMLTMQQFRRVSDALECEFFTERQEALKWLRCSHYD